MTKEEKINLIKYHLGQGITLFLKGNHPELYEEINSLYPQLINYPFKQKLYWFINNITDFPICDICKSPNKRIIQNIRLGHRVNICSRKCSVNHPETIKKKINTWINKYGVDNPFKSDIIKRKIVNTNLEKYGVEHNMQSDAGKQRFRDSCIDKYGVDHPSKVKEFQDKKKKTWIMKYGESHPLKNRKVLEKQKQTNLRKYGVEHTTEVEEFKKRIKATNIEKYGVDNPFKADIIKNKIKTTNNRKNIDNPNRMKLIQEKIKNTNIEKYGTNSFSRTPEYKEKYKNTSLDIYGVEYPTQDNKIKQKTKNTITERYGTVDNPSPENISQTNHFKELIPSIQEKIYNTKKKNNTFKTSNPENEIYKNLIIKYPDTIRQYKDEKYPYNCDFYIPSNQLYIEINFSWMHGKEAYTGAAYQKKIVAMWLERSNELNFRKKPKAAYLNAINSWTRRDVEKKICADRNKLNWLCFYTKSKFYAWFSTSSPQITQK